MIKNEIKEIIKPIAKGIEKGAGSLHKDEEAAENTIQIFKEQAGCGKKQPATQVIL